MLSIRLNPIYSRATIEILPCTKCGKSMRLASIGDEICIFERSEND